MEKMEILLVEDNAGDAVLIRQILAVNLHIVRDGQEALTILSDSDFQPGLIFWISISRVFQARSYWSDGRRRKSRWLSLVHLSTMRSKRG